MSGIIEGIFGGGGQPEPQVTTIPPSPYQQKVWGYAEPLLQQLTSGMPYQIPGLPSTAGLMPTAGWYGGLDPNIRAGIEEPYMRGMEMMRSQLAGTGQLGAPRAGISGAAADVFGQYMQQAAPRMAATGWGMMQPGLMAGYQGLMQRRGEELQRAQLPYNILPGMIPGTYPTQAVTPGRQPGGAAGMLGGGVLGAGLYSMLGLSQPYMWPMIGAGALLGGK